MINPIIVFRIELVYGLVMLYSMNATYVRVKVSRMAGGSALVMKKIVQRNVVAVP